MTIATALERRIVFGLGDGTLNAESLWSEPRVSAGAAWYRIAGRGVFFGPYPTRSGAEAADAAAQVRDGLRCRALQRGDPLICGDLWMLLSGEQVALETA